MIAIAMWNPCSQAHSMAIITHKVAHTHTHLTADAITQFVR